MLLDALFGAITLRPLLAHVANHRCKVGPSFVGCIQTQSFPNVVNKLQRSDGYYRADNGEHFVIALKMAEILEATSARGANPVAWRMRVKALGELRRQSRYTGDVRSRGGQLTFLAVPIEVADVRNSLGAELLTTIDNAAT